MHARSSWPLCAVMLLGLSAVVDARLVLAAAPGGADPAGTGRHGEPSATDRRRPIRVLLVNSGPYVIRAAYASPPLSPLWGENLLPAKRLDPAQQMLVELADGCGTYNLRFVADDGIEYLEDEIAFCTEREETDSATTEPRAYVILGRDDLKAVDPPRPAAAPAGERRRP